MNSKRVFYGMVATVFLLISSVILVVVFGSIWLSKRSEKLVAVKLDNLMVEDQKLALIAANKDIDTYKQLDAVAKSIVPRDKDQARAIRDIVQIAEDNGITIDGISFPSSTLGAKQAAVPASTDANTPAAPVAPKDSQVKAVPGVNGVYSVTLDVTPNSNNPISYSQLINFLERLENNRRTAQISRISISPKVGGLSFTMSVNIFIKPGAN